MTRRKRRSSPASHIRARVHRMTKFRNALPGVLATMAAGAVGALTPEVIAQLADAPDLRAIIGALVAAAAYRLRPLAVKSEAQ